MLFRTASFAARLAASSAARSVVAAVIPGTTAATSAAGAAAKIPGAAVTRVGEVPAAATLAAPGAAAVNMP